MPRAVIVLGWIVAASITLGLAMLTFELTRPPGAANPMPLPLDEMPAKQDRNPWARWSVTEQLAAEHVLIVHVETRHLDEARAVARYIVDPVIAKEKYAEVLVYFHRPGRPDTLPPRRVQWTPANGYVESVYTPD
jgi:hypothetical protein